jgi:hypothetical protein
MTTRTEMTDETTGPIESVFSRDLRQAAAGDAEARRRLWAEHYATLQECADRWFAKEWENKHGGAPISLCGTAIVNQVYERLVDRTQAMAHGRAWFFEAFYTECMRIAIDRYRSNRRHRGRGAMARVEMPSQLVAPGGQPVDFDAVCELIEELRQENPLAASVAQMRIFESVEDGAGGRRGLEHQEIAERLGVSESTVEKRWKLAKAFFARRLRDRGEQAQDPEPGDE